MDISKMSDREKSVLFASFMPDWKLSKNGFSIMTPGGIIVDLYEIDPRTGLPKHMALAWKAIEWITMPVGKRLYMHLNVKFVRWWLDPNTNLWAENGPDAQRAWLDKVLELAIEAGLVEHTD